MDNQRIIEDIKSRIDIVDFISNYVDLKKTGRNYKALCPFHSERTPSFVVNPEKQVFHCFGCGTGGDIIGFTMKQEGLSFIESVHLLAEKAGIKISRDQRSTEESIQRRDILLRIQKDAMHHFIDSLKKSDKALKYLYNRGLSDTTIKTFSIGYAPDQRDALYRLLKREGFSDTDLVDSGVVKGVENGYQDVFRGRIMFPIFNLHGKPVAFGGRVIDEGMPKYLNSSETPLFKKGETLFGLHLTRNDIMKKGFAIIVEGYLDMIACFQHGITNVFATLGTSLTENHVKMIKRYTKSILLIFDGDPAGISAAKRSLDTIFSYGLVARVLLLPENSDPDSFLKSHGETEFQKMISRAQDFIDFMLSTGGNTMDTLRDIFHTLSHVQDAILKSKLLSDLADKASISEAILREEMGKVKKNKKPLPSEQKKTQIKSAEEILLGIYLSFPEMTDRIHEHLNPGDIDNPLIKKIFHDLYTRKGKVSLSGLSSMLTKEEMAYVSGMMIDPFIDQDHIEKNIKDCIKNIQKKNIMKTLHLLEHRIKLAESTKNEEALRSLLIEKQTILKEQSRVR